jgi:guanyl-specific ribonuclease Sa
VSRHKEKKKKSSSSKKDKLLVVKKSDLNHSSKAKIIITKSNEKTLENFHSFTKKSTCKPDGKLLGNQVKTAKNSNYNAASLASLANENLSGSNLKDIVKKSPNFVKKLNNFHNAGSVNRSLSEHERCANNNGSGVKLKKAAIDLDLDEKRLKRELGEETVKAVESYFNTLRRNYYRYLIHRKSSEFSEKIQDEIKKEHDIKKEYLKYTRKFELDTDSLLKTNVDLLKRRTDELGIKNLQYPHEIISHAQELLSDHKELLEKIEKADKEVKQKKILNNQLEPESRSHNTNKKSLYADTSIPPIQKATAPKPPPKSTLLDKLLSVIDSKNTENLPATTTTAITTITSSSITTTTSNSTNSAQNKKKPLPTPKLLATQTSQSSSYDSQSSEKENLNNTLEITLPSIIKRETHVDDILIDVDDVRSVESLPNSDTTTITANERGGAIDEDGTDTDNNEVASVSDKKLVTKCKNNISSFVQHSKGVNNSNVSNLKNFKIPKQNTIKSEATPTAILAPLPTQMATADQIKASSFALVDVTSSTPTNTSSTLVNPLAFDFNNPQKSTNYYHPKKNQFRQYMMESSTISICKSEPESSSSLAAAPVVSDSS